MKIRITRGIYGFEVNGNVIEKTKSDPPFEVNDEEGERLIFLNVAKSVADTEEMAGAYTEKADYKDVNAGGGAGNISREDLENMSKDDLCRLAEELGIKKNGSKTDLLERLLQCPVWYEDEEPLDEDEMPELNAEDPE